MSDNFTSFDKYFIRSLTKDRVPDLDDLLRQVEMDELAETAHQKEGEQRTDFSTEEHFDGNHDGDENKVDLEDSILDELLNEGEDDGDDDDEDENDE